MTLFTYNFTHFYYTYKTGENLENLKRYNLDNLNILRFDITEQTILNYRLEQHKNINENIKFSKNYYREPNAPLKNIGFISRDFHEKRPSGQLTIKFFKLIKELFPQINIHFFMYISNPISDLFKNLANVYLCENNELLKERIALNKIDILIDMQGHMHDNFNEIFSIKHAPLQIHWLGYPGTSGIKSIDYLIADKIIVPEESQQFYSEKLAYLPNCYQCNNDDLLITESNLKRADFKIPEDAFVFCHFNHEYKLDRATWYVWMKILTKVPNSVLMLTTFNAYFIKVLLHDANINNIDKSRIIWIPYERDREKHFNRINLCDLGLDTYRLNGHTSSSDLIASGVPFITYSSDTYHNRVGKSILNSIDLNELVCDSFDDYINKAIYIALNKSYYKEIKDKVINNRTKTFFNTKLYVNNFIQLLQNLWDNRDQNCKEIESTNPTSITTSNNALDKLNKDYTLPKIMLIYTFSCNKTFKLYIKTLFNYLYNQYYLNAELIILIDESTISSVNINFLETSKIFNKIKIFETKQFYNTLSCNKEDIEKNQHCIYIENENIIDICKNIFYVQQYYENTFTESSKSNEIFFQKLSGVKEINTEELLTKKMKQLSQLSFDTNYIRELPHIYWINLERSPERKDNMLKLFKDYSLENTRIPAYDFADFDSFCLNTDFQEEITNSIDNIINNKKKCFENTFKSQIDDVKIKMLKTTMFKKFDEIKKKGEIQINLKKKQISCLLSHIKAVKEFLKSKRDICIIAEDDLSFEYCKFWDKSFNNYITDLPADWECLQLVQTIPIHQIQNSQFLIDRLKILSQKTNFSWSTVAYMINRKGAEKLLASIDEDNGKYLFFDHKTAIADVFIYKKIISYSIPLFTYNDEESIIDSDALHESHITNSKDIITNLWLSQFEK